MKASSIEGALTSVTKKYTSMRKKEERANRVFLNRSDYMYSTRVTVKEIAWEVMEEAYMKASSGGTLPAYVRQIMYAARPMILEQCDKSEFTSAYFTQTLLPDYIEEFGCEHWNVVYDARGHLFEPHTTKGEGEIGIGTSEVNDYLLRASTHSVEDDLSPSVDGGTTYPTSGPENRYSGILFIEKEGFFPLFRQVKLAEKWDIAIMSNKGMSVVAGRELMSRLDIPVYVLHDFDAAGFSIVGTLMRGTRRFPEPLDNVIDLGLRLADVQECGLDPEPTHHSIGDYRMSENGATEEEIEFLHTQRVELNAFASDDLIEWIEKKLVEHGVEKVIPDADVLETAYRRAAKAAYLNQRLDELDGEATTHVDQLGIPTDLSTKVRDMIVANDGTPTKVSWDGAINVIAGGDDEEDEA